MRLKVKHFLWFCLILPPWLGWVGYRIVTWPEMPPRADWQPMAPEHWSAGAYPQFNEDVVLAYKGRDIGESAHADAAPDSIYRIDVRQFLADKHVTSLRVDLDRDAFFDAHFHFDDREQLTLEWSTEDNEVYDQYLLWTGKGWVATARPAASAGHRSNVAPPVAAVLAWQGRSPSVEQGADVTPDTPWRIDIIHAGGAISSVLLDLDRDAQWDQRWDFTTDPVEVRVFPTDDGVTEVPYIWNGVRLTPR